MARLLLVDDELRFRTHLGRILEAWGHEVRIAADVAGALEAARSFEPELLIADWMLRSSSDGLELAEALRARDPGLRVVLITGHPSDALLGRVAAGELAAVLEKPFTPAELRELLERVLAPVSPGDPDRI
jgi:two-component system nitrogen regulation response regulator NtrX